MIIKKSTAAELIVHENFRQLRDEYIAECANVELPVPQEQEELYKALDATGVLHAFGAYVGNRLIGFCVILAPVLPHYGRIVSTVDSIFVGKDYRHTGAGIKLIRQAEQCAKDVGSPALIFSCPIGGSLERLLPRLKYKATNVAYSKRFGHE